MTTTATDFIALDSEAITGQATGRGWQPLDLAPYRHILHTFQQLEDELNIQLLERREVVRAALVALLTREHLVLLGPPGTAKSMLVNELARRIADTRGHALQTFIALLTRFSTPEELFGPISVQGLKQDVYRRITRGMLPEAHLAFLDETFKANSAILNALLTLLNERLFDNGGQRTAVPLISLFGASNEMPEGEELSALWDRFLLRQVVGYVSDAGFHRLLRLAAASRTPTTLAVDDLATLQGVVEQVVLPDSVLDQLTDLRKQLAGEGIEASDRRWRGTLPVLRAHALLEGRGVVIEDDLAVLQHVLWSEPEGIRPVARTLAQMANPLNAKAMEWEDQAHDVYQSAMAAQRDSSLDERARMDAALEANGKIKHLLHQLRRLQEQAHAQGRHTQRVEEVIEQVKSWQLEITDCVLN